MNPRTRERGPAANEAPPEITRHRDADRPKNSARARQEQLAACVAAYVTIGLMYPPMGRRRSWALVVQRCPLCQHCHVHRLDHFMPVVVRSPSCRPWVTYEVRAYVVLPGVPS